MNLKIFVKVPAQQALCQGSLRIQQRLAVQRCGAHFGSLMADKAVLRNCRCMSSASVEGLVEVSSNLDWKTPLGYKDGFPPVVALGKFDAMHIGHRALAETAASMNGQPWLISFSGMAEVLQWEPRLPIVPLCERPSVLESWAPYCMGLIPRMRYLPFREIRSMSPEDFVHLLSQKLGAAGIVAGENYRFGYKAAGDAEMLQQLGEKHGMKVQILSLVSPGGETLMQKVSTSEVRDALSNGNMSRVETCLGRKYRLYSEGKPASFFKLDQPGGVFIPYDSFLNQPPAIGTYSGEIHITSELENDSSDENEPLKEPFSSMVEINKGGLQLHVPGFNGCDVRNTKFMVEF